MNPPDQATAAEQVPTQWVLGELVKTARASRSAQNISRLSKFLAQAGIASRRKAETLIRSGNVKVNNVTVLDPFFRVTPHKDAVTVDNTPVSSHIKLKYIALHKPVGYLSDLTDKRNRKLARAFINDNARLFPIGRLDYQSEGLMLFTNDGAFADRIMHPRYEVEKEYLVKFKGHLNQQDLRNLMEGVVVDGERYLLDNITLLRAEKENSWYRIIIHEGRKRMIRRVADAVSHPVIKLRRIRIGQVRLGCMKPGEHRPLTQREISFFLRDQRASAPPTVR
ncbi:MAG TPA: pseudouridine synthase [Syntrophorhabdales bacterium]|nr:pseudouridine synthase [Syntrophorhabdales bacterium]